MLVSYVEPSMDAAIAEDILDLKFKNSYKTPVYIEAYYADGALTFHIYGERNKSRKPDGGVCKRDTGDRRSRRKVLCRYGRSDRIHSNSE